MEIQPLKISDVLLIRPKVAVDSRGFFLEIWQREKFKRAGLDMDFVQDNRSRSCKHTLRGLHYQIQQPQGKLVSVSRGLIFDVAVDLRRSSSTFGKWVGEYLSDENHRSMWVPPGFAHGFLVLSESADFSYKCTDFYAPQFERSIRWDDLDLAIDWPLPQGADPLLAPKDAIASGLAASETFP